MILDHIGFVFRFSTLRYAGRIAFPIYAFLIGEGCLHTKNIKRYLLRLLFFAFISEIPFDLMRSAAMGRQIQTAADLIDLSAQNVFFTLFLGAFCLAVYLHVKKITGDIAALFIGLITMIACAYAAELLRSDYGSIGVIIISAPIIVSDLVKREDIKRQVRILTTALCLCYLYRFAGDFLIAALISLIFILIYNGRAGRPIKWVFYLIYPVHMIILSLIWLYL